MRWSTREQDERSSDRGAAYGDSADGRSSRPRLVAAPGRRRTRVARSQAAPRNAVAHQSQDTALSLGKWTRETRPAVRRAPGSDLRADPGPAGPRRSRRRPRAEPAFRWGHDAADPDPRVARVHGPDQVSIRPHRQHHRADLPAPAGRAARSPARTDAGGLSLIHI